MPFFAFQYSGMQKMASFLLTGKIGAPPRRAATMAIILAAPLVEKTHFHILVSGWGF
jgi:hypothetical protein